MNELLPDVFLVGMDDPQRWVEQVAATVSPGVSCAPPPLEPLAHWRAIYPMARAIGNWRNACDCADDESAWLHALEATSLAGWPTESALSREDLYGDDGR